MARRDRRAALIVAASNADRPTRAGRYLIANRDGQPLPPEGRALPPASWHDPQVLVECCGERAIPSHCREKRRIEPDQPPFRRPRRAGARPPSGRLNLPRARSLRRTLCHDQRPAADPHQRRRRARLQLSAAAAAHCAAAPRPRDRVADRVARAHAAPTSTLISAGPRRAPKGKAPYAPRSRHPAAWTRQDVKATRHLDERSCVRRARNCGSATRVASDGRNPLPRIDQHLQMRGAVFGGAG